jgi:Lrp/AsnC family transcriptional regulator, leucine-responsive regulatory protein
MDAIDHRLLQLLREDASRPLKTLAAEVSLSRSSVRDRIARMEADGTIRGYTIVTAPADGALRAILLVRLLRTPDPDVVRAVVSAPEVARCYSLSGDIDLMVELVADGTAAINAARDRIADLPGVTAVVTSLVLNRDQPGDEEAGRGPSSSRA